MSSIIKLIQYEEGWNPLPYKCSEGYPTIGYGFKIGNKNTPLSSYKLVLPQSAGDAWLKVMVEGVERDMLKVSEINAADAACNNARHCVLVSMAYQMGISGLSGFHNMLQAIVDQDWNLAAHEMLDSRWAAQTPKRARRHAEQMRSGEWFGGY